MLPLLIRLKRTLKTFEYLETEASFIPEWSFFVTCYNVLIVLRDGVDLILPIGIFDDSISITLHNRYEKTNSFNIFGVC